MLIRILQALMATATVYLAYRLAVLIARREAAGLLAAGVLAVAPAFVIETAQISTETLYLFLVAAGLWLYLRGIISFVNRLPSSCRQRRLSCRASETPSPLTGRVGVGSHQQLMRLPCA